VKGTGGEHPVDVGAKQADLGGALAQFVHGSLPDCQPSKTRPPGMTDVTSRANGSS
jgi:hypothetical protein